MPPKMGGRGGAGRMGAKVGGKMGGGGKMGANKMGGNKMGANKMGANKMGANKMGSGPGNRMGSSRPGAGTAMGGRHGAGVGMKPGGGMMSKPGAAGNRLCAPGQKGVPGAKSPVPLRAHGQIHNDANLGQSYQQSKQALRTQNFNPASVIKEPPTTIQPADNFGRNKMMEPALMNVSRKPGDGDLKMPITIIKKEDKFKLGKDKDKKADKKDEDKKKDPTSKALASKAKGRARAFLLSRSKKTKTMPGSSGLGSGDEGEENSWGDKIAPILQDVVATKLITGAKYQKEERLEGTEADVHRDLTYRDLERMKFQDIERLIQNTVGGTALTSSTPTALSSHMDPRLLQAASGIQGTGLMGTQLSTIPQDSELPHEGPDTPSSADQVKFDAAILATHPEQIGDGEQEEMFAEERIPSDPMKVKLIDTAAAEQVDGAPTPTLVLPPQASSAPPPEDLSSVPTTPGPVSPGLAPQLGTLPPQQPSQLSGIPATQMSAPAYSYESYDSSPYGENLYNQQPGYDPLQDQYHMSAPLLENGHQGGDHMFYPQPAPSRYPQTHKSYYHFSQMQNPDKYNFTKAIQNYDRASQNDGMYCYSCIMFFGVLMIGVGIIMIIVELFDLFGRHKDMPVAIAGGGTLFLGIIVLASAMLLWRRRRTIMKKKAAHV